MIKDIDGKSPKIDGSCFIAESADIIGDVIIDSGSSVWYSCVIRGDISSIRIGKNTNIQDGTVVHVDGTYPTKIGDNVTIGHKSIIHGCTIGNNVLIGMGAIILSGAVVEDNTIVAAGSVVTPQKPFIGGKLYIGSPAKERRDLSEEEIKGIISSAEHYVENGRKHRKI